MREFTNVSVNALANVYFDGRVVSHTVQFPDGTKKTLGILFPGTYKFKTEAPELMEIIDGSCEISIDGSDTTRFIPTDESFNVDGNSGFTITVNSGTCQYICSYL
ncbi:pyrimidine/purine nucleoside phosphorylase [Luteolibacter sp. AS25]|uniref:pyrimidine/purine nucleoside phosphorylase n=1 Tax=Luteolibacter sp. AS25 TaxID=3135776 RepID=UPI00398A75E5